MNRRSEVGFAVLLGVLTHAVFVLAVSVMFIGLYTGLQVGLGPFDGWMAWAANLLLVAQFPILHSYFLSKRGRSALARIAPGRLGADLAPTTYALAASLQLLVVFGLWSTSGVVLYEPDGVSHWIIAVVYVASWLFLVKALKDAGLGLQTGFIGWISVVRGKRPAYDGFPTSGLFRFCRHPVYLGFALVLWTPPVMTPDELLLAVGWTAYCLIGPRFKEARYRAMYGDAYQQYCDVIPYILPGRRRLPANWTHSGD